MKNNFVQSYLRNLGINPDSSSEGLLLAVAEAFSRIPYENLTKIIKCDESGSTASAKSSPDEVLHDHSKYGSGGTCFTLTDTLLHIIRGLGWATQPIFADRRYGINTHCAILLWKDGIPHLMDPGFLINRPVPLIKSGEVTIDSPFNQMVLKAKEDGAKIDLYTIERGQPTFRMTYKTGPVDESEFLKVWESSFDWDMMKYPLLTRVNRGRQIYLRGNRLQSRERDQVQKEEIGSDDLVARIYREFGIAPVITSKALHILKQKGEFNG